MEVFSRVPMIGDMASFVTFFVTLSLIFLFDRTSAIVDKKPDGVNATAKARRPTPKICYWQKYKIGNKLPPYAVIGGIDSGNYPMYVGRVSVKGKMFPVKVVPNIDYIGLADEDLEVQKDECELLIGINFEWIPYINEVIPPNALFVDNRDLGSRAPIYVGRAYYEDTLTVGRVNVETEKLYIGYNSVEIALDKFEILAGSFITCASQEAGSAATNVVQKVVYSQRDKED